MAKISAIVLARNEEGSLLKCLKALSWCDEIILIDDYSTDKTHEIAKKFEAKIYKRKLNNDFSSQRNFALKKAKYEWSFFVDSDEIVTELLANEIRDSIDNEGINGFWVNRLDVFMGQKMNGGEWGSQWLLRVVRTKKGKWEREVHEVLKVDGQTAKLSSPLLHSPAKNLKSYISKINFYSSIHSRSNKTEGKNENLLKIIFWPIAKFFVNFFIKRGYKDGTHGFVFAVMMSFHSFLSWSKQWELEKKN